MSNHQIDISSVGNSKVAKYSSDNLKKSLSLAKKLSKPELDLEKDIEYLSLQEQYFDISSRLLRERIVFLGSKVDDKIANKLITEMLFLESEDPNKDIQLYINSPGGSVVAGMAIYETMNQITPDICTIAVGCAAGMGGFLLSAGTKSKRMSMPNARIMIRQPSGGVQGQAIDIEIQVRQIFYHQKKLNEILAHHTGQPLDKLAADTYRDFWMSPTEAQAYGLIDKVK